MTNLLKKCYYISSIWFLCGLSSYKHELHNDLLFHTGKAIMNWGNEFHVDNTYMVVMVEPRYQILTVSSHKLETLQALHLLSFITTIQVIPCDWNYFTTIALAWLWCHQTPCRMEYYILCYLNVLHDLVMCQSQ